MAVASGALQRATPALELVQSRIPLQAHPKPRFPAHQVLMKKILLLWSISWKQICSTSTAAMPSTALAQGREKV